MRVWRAGCSSAPVWVSVGVCVCVAEGESPSLCVRVFAPKSKLQKLDKMGLI